MTTRNTTTTVTIDTFAYNIGCMLKQTREASQPFHDAYASGDKAQRADLRVRWFVGHIMGHTGVTAKKATAVYEAAKSAAATVEGRKAWTKAQSDYEYHVVRNPKTGTHSNEATKVRITAGERAAFVAYMAAFTDAKRAAVVFKALSAKA